MKAKSLSHSLILRHRRSSISITFPVHERHAETIQAMQQGFDVIYQASLSLEPFAGKADFLIKVDTPSKLGDYSYWWDSKLAFSLKPYFIIQLCCYAQMIEQIQGVLPENIGVMLGDKTEVTVRTADYYYYYLAPKDKFLKAQASFDLNQIPDPFWVNRPRFVVRLCAAVAGAAWPFESNCQYQSQPN